MTSNPTPTFRRATAVGAVALTAALALTGCMPSVTSGSDADADRLQAPTSASPKGEITIWDRSGDLYKVFDAVIDDFNEKYPDITVQHEAVDIDAKLQNTLITGTDVPDGVFLDDAMVGGYKDYLWDLDDVMEPYEDDIAKQKVDVTTVDGAMYGCVKYFAYSSLKAAKSRSECSRCTVDFTTSSRVAPCSARTARMFASTCAVCPATSSAIAPVAGSCGPKPAV
jgi:hypothetical protein